MLGDSFVEAAQVPIAKKFHVVLESVLRTAFPGMSIDTVAMGFSGAGQSSELSFYEAFGKDLQPDLVIDLVVSNDLANNSSLIEAMRVGFHPLHAPRLFFDRAPSGNGFVRHDIDPDWEKYKLPARTGIELRDHALRLNELRRDPGFARRLAGWQFPDDLDLDTMFCANEMPPVFEEAVAITGHVFHRFADLARRDGFRFMVVAAENVTTICNRLPVQRRATSPSGNIDRVRRAVGDAGVPFLDLYPLFAARGELDKVHFARDGHWNEVGHAAAATAIAAYLRQNPELLGR